MGPTTNFRKKKKYEKGELCVWVVGGDERETEARDKRDKRTQHCKMMKVVGERFL